MDRIYPITTITFDAEKKNFEEEVKQYNFNFFHNLLSQPHFKYIDTITGLATLICSLLI
jgi:hypothetical protein